MPREILVLTDLPQAVQDRLAVEADRDTHRANVRAQFTAAQTRLTDIVDNGAGWNATQIRDAVVDLARIQRRMLRLLRRL